MPERKRTAKRTAAKKSTAKKPVAKTTAPTPKKPAAPPPTPAPKAPGATCPRCGSSTFGPEQRTRVDGNRTVRYTILVCERGHEFARPREAPS